MELVSKAAQQLHEGPGPEAMESMDSPRRVSRAETAMLLGQKVD